jgi:hypothetical protein
MTHAALESYAAADAWPGVRDRLLMILRRLVARALPPPLAAGKGLLTRAERWLVLKWLQPLERMARCLILFAAFALPKERYPPPAWWRRPPFYVRPPCTERRRSRCFPIAGRAQSLNSGPPMRGPDGLCSAWVLVDRLEIVLDVLEDPGPHIARLARRLGRSRAVETLGLRFARPSRPRPKPVQIGDLAYPYAVAEAEGLMAIALPWNTS